LYGGLGIGARRARGTSVLRTPFRGWQQTVALRLLAGELARTTDRLGPFARCTVRRLLEKSPPFHFPENAFALHFLLQDAERLVNIVVADKDLQFRRSCVRQTTVSRAATHSATCVAVIQQRPQALHCQ
jgi:hypothetical protein